jgi:hypothetical protein
MRGMLLVTGNLTQAYQMLEKLSRVRTSGPHRMSSSNTPPSYAVSSGPRIHAFQRSMLFGSTCKQMSGSSGDLASTCSSFLRRFAAANEAMAVRGEIESNVWA